MKRKNVFFGILYYPLVMLVYLTALKVTSLVFNALPDVGLGGLAVLIYGMVFVEIPAVTAVMMRFSLFKLYVDPIAAAEMPLLLYALMLAKQICAARILARLCRYAENSPRCLSSVA